MLGMVFKGGRSSLTSDLTRPDPGKDSVLIRVILAGICSTDIEITKGYMGYEGVLGHEFVGLVEAPGDSSLNGRRVVGGINCACGRCDLCLRGRERHCPHRTVLGIVGQQGAFAEYISLPKKNLVRVPDHISNEDAVYAEPVAAVLRAYDQAQVSPEHRLAILGDGRLGLLAGGIARSFGWNVTLIGKHPNKLDKIDVPHLMYGSQELPERSFDVVMDCTGSEEGLFAAVRLLRPEGKLILKTTIAGQHRRFDFTQMVINEITLIGSRCGSMTDAVDYLGRSSFHPSVLTSARFALSNAEAAFKSAVEPDTIKVLLDVAPVS